MTKGTPETQASAITRRMVFGKINTCGEQDLIAMGRRIAERLNKIPGADPSKVPAYPINLMYSIDKMDADERRSVLEYLQGGE